MATESPAIHDGSQTVAAANYSNTQSLAGPSGSGQFLGVALTVSTSRSVTLASVAGQQIYGVLQNKPTSGAVADVVIFCITKAVAAAAGVTAGKPQMVTATGAFTDWTSTGNKAQVGYAIETATSGQVFTLFIGPTGNTVA
jgi:hypothetical protein